MEFVTNNNKTVKLPITQAAGTVLVVNIAPNPILGYILPDTEDLEAFSLSFYRISQETQELVSTTQSAAEEALATGMATGCRINWSPYGEINYCDYKFYGGMGSVSQSDCFNPDITGTIVCRWELNTTLVRGNRYFNLSRAAFHQGSPIIEVVFATSGWHIYTLHAYQARYHSIAQTLSVTCTYSTVTPTVVNSAECAPSVLAMISDIILQAGQVNVRNMQPMQYGASRIVLTTTAMVTGTYRFRILKWYMDWNTGKLVAFVSIGTNVGAGKFNPTRDFTTTQLNRLEWISSYDAQVVGQSILTPDEFYNP